MLGGNLLLIGGTDPGFAGRKRRPCFGSSRSSPGEARPGYGSGGLGPPLRGGNLCPGRSLSTQEDCIQQAVQRPHRMWWPRRRVPGRVARGVFDALGRRSIESPHFPPSGLGAVRPGGRSERGREENEESMSLLRLGDRVGRMSMRKERTKL
jgi:hypothetical protein